MTMTFDHPRWTEFHDRLEGPEGCNVRVEDGTVKWECKDGTDKTHARAILRAMGLTDAAIEASCAYFEARGGFCDHEIVMNLDLTDVDEDLIRQDETTDRALAERAAQEGNHAD